MSTEFPPKALAIINQMKLQRDQANDTVCEIVGLLAEEKVRFERIESSCKDLESALASAEKSLATETLGCTQVVNDFAGLERRYESLDKSLATEKVKYANLQLNYENLQRELNLVDALYKESEHELKKVKGNLASNPIA